MHDIESLLAGDDASLALTDGHSIEFTRRDVRQRVRALAIQLRESGAQRVALLADNSPWWVIADLACLAADVPLVPLPPFFAPMQMAHAVDAAGIDTLLATDADIAIALGFAPQLDACHVALGPLVLTRRVLASEPVLLPAGTAKITFTSGTTGTPKGVCLSAGNQLVVAQSLMTATEDAGVERHLVTLPLAVLLENIAGVYAPIMARVTVVVPSLADVGMHGSSGFDPVTALKTVTNTAVHSVVLVPEMLRALVAALQRGMPCPPLLRFVAVGGGRLSVSLLEQALILGLPVYEGYGLSECASVVAMNRLHARRLGTVGMVLPHLAVTATTDGALLIHGNTFLGYLGDAPHDPSLPVDSGDLGHIDDDGYLHLDGRQKNLLITGFGRNVAPEWPEAELVADGTLAQTVVFGEGAPWLAALVVPARADVTPAQIAESVARANARLPDYARVHRWQVVAPFTPGNGQLTANGRPRRQQIADVYAPLLDSLFHAAEEAPRS